MFDIEQDAKKPPRDIARRLEASAVRRSQAGLLDAPFSTAQVAICVRE